MSDQKKERYQLVRKLGEGGMGEVWLALDTLLHRPVAVKYLPVTADRLYQEYFVNEVQILASLNHPNITAVYDAVLDQAHNQFYCVMEYVEGRSLAELLADEEALSLDLCLEIGLKLLNALKYAHRREVIHRDLKPANIIIAEDVKLTDFGLADFASKLAAGFPYAVGTEGYISPEQNKGQPVDGRTDLYAFGVVLFNLLTGGKMPFEDDKSNWPEHPTPLRQAAPEAPVALERLILRLLAPNPADRFASAEEVINALGALRWQLKFKQTQQLGLLEADPKPLVGRSRELKQLLSLWEETQRTARPALLVLQGASGVGKKRLVAEFVKEVVNRGGTAVGGRCDELRSPYLPFVDIFETLFTQGLAPIPELERAQSLVRQLPALADLLQVPIPTDKRDPQASQWECFEAASFVFNQLGPICIYLDEASYLDQASADLLRYLLRRGKFPGLVIASVRTSGQTPAQPGHWSAHDGDHELRLEPLQTPELCEYLNYTLGGRVAPEVAEVVSKRSAGNLVYADEIARHWLQTRGLQRNPQDEWTFASTEVAQAIPTPLANILKRQVLERLDEKQRQSLAAAALLGVEFEFSAWLAVLGGPPQLAAAVETLDRAISLPILREVSPERYLFNPVEVAQILIETLHTPRRRLLHQQIAEHLSKQKGNPLSIAHHFVEAGTTAEAARALELAGAQAANANAIQQAIALYTRAVSLRETSTAYTALGRLHRQQGQAAKAREALQRALELARQTGDREAEARALNGLAFVLWLYDAYVESYRTAASVLKIEGVSAVNLAEAETHQGMVAWEVGQLVQAEQHCRRAVELLKSTHEPDSLGGAYSRLGLVCFSLGRLSEAEEVFNRSLAIRRALKDFWGEGFLTVNQGRIALERGEFERAWSLLTEAGQLFEKIESRDGLMVARTNQGQALLRRGRPQEALSRLDEAARLAQQIGKLSGYGVSEIDIFRARAWLALNDPGQAQTLVEAALKTVTAAGNQEQMVQGQLVLAQVAAAQGRAAIAEEWYQKALALAQQIGFASGVIHTQWRYARFLAARGETEHAAPLEQAARQEAGRLGFALDE